jgi:hypothetical protein
MDLSLLWWNLQRLLFFIIREADKIEVEAELQKETEVIRRGDNMHRIWRC